MEHVVMFCDDDAGNFVKGLKDEDFQIVERAYDEAGKLIAQKVISPPFESSSYTLGGPVVGKSATFEQAVQSATEQLQKLELGKFFIVDVAEIQRQGVLLLELSALLFNILKDWGYSLPARTTALAGLQRRRKRD